MANQGFNWRDANKQCICDLLAIENLVDERREHEREKQMGERIKAMLQNNKRTVIITGVAHLKYFEELFPQAQFPFR